MIIGIVITALGAVLKFGLNLLLSSESIDLQEIQPLLDLSSLDTIAIVIIIVGVFIIVLSAFGLCGACCTNRFLLIIYEILIIVIFLGHLIALIVAAVKLPELEDLFKKQMDDFVQQINDNVPSTKDLPPNLNDKCVALKFISELFECCGSTGPGDFKNPAFATECCSLSGTGVVYGAGCTTTVVDFIKDKSTLFIVVPNSIIIVFEFIIVVITAVLIVKITRQNKERHDYNPTVYYKR